MSAGQKKPPMISVQDLWKSFGDNHVLTGINLDIPEGSTCVILGGSGSGKTVLMKHMIGLLKPDKGKVIVDGEDIVPMDDRELEGVLAHEVSHIRNRDVRLMTLVALLVGVIALLADILLRMAFFGGSKRANFVVTIMAFAALLLAPVAAVIIQLAVSRRREYLADASAAEITNDAEGMALALRTLQIDQQETKRASRAVAHMYIESPLRQASGANALLGGMFSTHPPLEKRIAALEEAGGFHLAAA